MDLVSIDPLNNARIGFWLRLIRSILTYTADAALFAFNNIKLRILMKTLHVMRYVAHIFSLFYAFLLCIIFLYSPVARNDH